MLKNPSLKIKSDHIIKTGDIAKKHNIVLNNEVLEYHVCELEINNWIQELTATFSFIARKFIPTRRFNNIFIETDDPNVMSNVKERIRMMLLPRTVGLGEVELYKSHTEKFPNPIEVNCNMFRWKKTGKSLEDQIDNYQIMCLPRGYQIKITAEIVEDSTINSLDIKHNLMNVIMRRGMETYHEKGTDKALSSEYPYNRGILTVKYSENITAKELIKEVFKILIDKIDFIVQHYDELVTFSAGNIIIEVNDDPSAVICNLIKRYVYYETEKLHYLSCITKGKVSRLILTIQEKVAVDKIHKQIKSALEKIKTHSTFSSK